METFRLPMFEKGWNPYVSFLVIRAPQMTTGIGFRYRNWRHAFIRLTYELILVNVYCIRFNKMNDDYEQVI